MTWNIVQYSCTDYHYVTFMVLFEVWQPLVTIPFPCKEKSGVDMLLNIFFFCGLPNKENQIALDWLIYNV